MRTVVGPTASGLIEVAYTLDEVYAEAGERFMRHHSYYRRGEHGIEYLSATGTWWAGARAAAWNPCWWCRTWCARG
ncbi:MAG: hypothetical protein IPN77_33635 [Sandaracinaceae bacterium]|nr:hypothetical protein [Sandaracinaceae bacterium]